MKPVSLEQFLMTVFNITEQELEDKYPGEQAEEIREEYKHYVEHPEEYEEYFSPIQTDPVPPRNGKYDYLAVSKLFSENGEYKSGTYTVTIDGKTYTETVDTDDIDVYGLDYFDLMNPEFMQVCENIADKANANT